MLQIVTGKFFGTGQINQQEFDAVFYSNFSWVAPITTSIGEFRPSDASGARISTFVLRYTVRYERYAGDVLVLPEGSEVAKQFRLLAGLWFRAFFHPDRYHVEMLCRSDQRSSADSGVPSHFVDGFFDAPSRGAKEAIDGFSAFVDKVVAMPRKEYRLFMSCLDTFFDALEAIDTNQNLAYSMFAYVLEGLTQGADNFVPTWDDYPQDARSRLEGVFDQLSPEHADAIRDVLLRNPHLRLMKRFIGFSSQHIENKFFTTEALARDPALRKNELHQTLASLYSARSGYVHALKPIQQHLRLPSTSRQADVFHWGNEPHLTFSGLARLCRHVLLRFVERQPELPQENYPQWREELPGLITGQLAPHLWIGRVDGFKPESATKRFNGLVEHVALGLQDRPLVLPDLSDLLARIEKLMPQATKENKRLLICIYCLYTNLVDEKYRRPRWRELIETHADLLEECSVPAMAALVLLLGQFPWQPDECERVFDAYLKRKYKPRAVNLAATVEVAVMAEIANLHLSAGVIDRYRYWIERAIQDAAGKASAQEHLRACSRQNAFVSSATILGTAPSHTSDSSELDAASGADQQDESSVDVDGQASGPKPPRARGDV